jgi:hypothetical protein
MRIGLKGTLHGGRQLAGRRKRSGWLRDRQIAQLEQLRSTLDSGFLKAITSSELQQELDRRE